MKKFYNVFRMMLLAIPLALVASTGFAQTPGTISGGQNAAKSSGISSLDVEVTLSGFITTSIDGCGSNATSCITNVDKPAGATVRAAYMSWASVYGTGPVADGVMSINGTPITADKTVNNAGHWDNYWADVTSIVAPIVDGAAAGIIPLTIGETNGQVDGSLIVVVFDDPATTALSSLVMMFGGQLTTGDTFNLGLADPFDDATQDILMSLAISFGYQPTQQVSLIDVNGTRLTSSAGGQDDGESSNGGLITVGGLGDDPANPVDPNAGASDFRTDDELYTLDPLLSNGATAISVATVNPSNDDNIFFAAFSIRGTAAIVGEGITLGPTSSTNPINTNHTVTAKVQDDNGAPKSGVQVDFEITSGPNSGLTGSASTDANGEAMFTWSSAFIGTDVVVARFTDSQQQVQTSNEARKTWEDDNQPVCVDPSWDGSVVQNGGMLFLPISGGTGGVQVASFYNTSNLQSLGVYDAAFNDISASYDVSGTGGNLTWEWNAGGDAPAQVHLRVAAEEAGSTRFFVIVANNCTKIDIDPVLTLLTGPVSFTVMQNYPNPFRGSTTITVQLEETDNVTVDVYDLLGQHVRTIYDGDMSLGLHTLTWDGTAANGAAVSSGTYLYRVSTGDASRTMRMSLIK